MKKILYPDQLFSGYTVLQDEHYLVSSPTHFQHGQHLFKLLFHRASMKEFHQWLLLRGAHSKIVPIKQSSTFERCTYPLGKSLRVNSMADVLPLAKKWVLNNYQGVGNLDYYDLPYSNTQVASWLQSVVDRMDKGVKVPNVQAVYWLLLHIMPREVLESCIAKLPVKYQFVLDIEDVDYDTTINNPYGHTKKFVDHGMLENVEQDFERFGATDDWAKLATYFAITSTHPDEIYMYLKSRCLDHSPERTRHKVNMLITLQKNPVLTDNEEWNALVWTYVHKTQCNKKMYEQLQDMNDIMRSRYFMVADRILK